MPEFAAAIRSSLHPALPARARELLDAGFPRIGLCAPLYDRDVDPLKVALPRGAVACVELFLPYPRGVRPGEPGPFRLGSPHPDDRRDAVVHGTETLLFADQSGIPTILVPPVRLDPALRTGHRRLRSGGSSVPLRDAILASRRADARSRLDAFRSVLSRLLDVADRYSLRLALVPGGWADELPDPAESRECLREFRGGPLGLWADALNLDLARDLTPPDPAGQEIGELAGITIRDHDDEGNLAPLGDGALDRERLRPHLERSPIWLVDPPSDRGPESLQSDLRFLEALEGRPGSEPLFPAF